MWRFLVFEFRRTKRKQRKKDAFPSSGFSWLSFLRSLGVYVQPKKESTSLRRIVRVSCPTRSRASSFRNLVHSFSFWLSFAPLRLLSVVLTDEEMWGKKNSGEPSRRLRALLLLGVSLVMPTRPCSLHGGGLSFGLVFRLSVHVPPNTSIQTGLPLSGALMFASPSTRDRGPAGGRKKKKYKKDDGRDSGRHTRKARERERVERRRRRRQRATRQKGLCFKEEKRGRRAERESKRRTATRRHRREVMDISYGSIDSLSRFFSASLSCRSPGVSLFLSCFSSIKRGVYSGGTKEGGEAEREASIDKTPQSTAEFEPKKGRSAQQAVGLQARRWRRAKRRKEGEGRDFSLLMSWGRGGAS